MLNSWRNQSVLIMQKQSYILKEGLKKKILSFLSEIKSPKLIFTDPDLLNLFNFAYDFKFDTLLQEGDKLIEFQQDDEASDQSKAINLVFLLHPVPSAMRTIKSMIVRNQAKSITQKQYKICLIPKIDIVCVEELERLNIRNKVELSSFDFGLIPFPNRLFSLQLSAYCSQVDYFNSCVEGLLRLSKVNGKFQRVIGKGDKSQVVLKHFQSRSEQELSNVSERDDSLLVVIDRKIDLVTPMLTGHSYEALIDHFFGINLTSIRIPQKFLGKSGNKLQPYRLYNRDKVYDQIAHLDIVDNLNYLQKARLQFKSQINRRKQAAKTAQQISQVTQVWGVKYEQTNNHLSIINYIVNIMNEEMHFRNLINMQMEIMEQGRTNLELIHYLTLNYPPENILKLICFYSQVYPTTSFFTRYEKQLLQIMVGNYSNEHIHSFYQLQKAGLLKNSKIKNKWEQIVQAFDLLPIEPHSYTKVHIKYSALSVRFIEMLIKGRLTPEASALLGRQNYIKGLDREAKAIKQLFIFYVGGITYGQISCLRLLEKQLGIKIFIVTTNLLSGADLVRRELRRENF